MKIRNKQPDELAHIKSYLQNAITDCEWMIAPGLNPPYHLSANGPESRHFVTVTEDFLDAHPGDDALEALTQWALIRELQSAAGRERVTVTADGLRRGAV